MAKEHGRIDHKEGSAPISSSDEGSLKWAETDFWGGFMKQAMAIKPLRGTGRLPKIPGPPIKSPPPPAGIKPMHEVAEQAMKKQIKPAPAPLNYQQINQVTKVPEEMAGTLKYGPLGAKEYVKPPKPA